MKINLKKRMFLERVYAFQMRFLHQSHLRNPCSRALNPEVNYGWILENNRQLTSILTGHKTRELLT